MKDKSYPRRLRITWESFGPHWHELPAIADKITDENSTRMQRFNEGDDAFLQRVEADVVAQFSERAGEATGAEGFAFCVQFGIDLIHA